MIYITKHDRRYQSLRCAGDENCWREVIGTVGEVPCCRYHLVNRLAADPTELADAIIQIMEALDNHRLID